MFVATTVRKLNAPTVASQLRILSATSKNFSSIPSPSPEELEHFRKVFRTMPSYEESIASKDLPPFLEKINFIKPKDANQKYVEYADRILGGRFELTQLMKYFRAQHQPHLLMTEYLSNFDANKDGYVSKDEFEFGMGVIRSHEPKIKDVSFADFLKQADSNNDGKISVEECKAWLNKYVAIAN